MNEPKMNPDDPRLSAYAFGELSPEETAEVAAMIERDPALAAEVDAIRALGGELESALGAESLPETEPVALDKPIEFPLEHATVKRFPYFLVSGLAAAGFAVLVLVQSPDSPIVGPEEFTVYSEQSPTPTGSVAADSAQLPPEIEVTFPDPVPAVAPVARSQAADQEEVVGLSAFEVTAVEEKAPIRAATAQAEPEMASRLMTAAKIVADNDQRRSIQAEEGPMSIVSSHGPAQGPAQAETLHPTQFDNDLPMKSALADTTGSNEMTSDRAEVITLSPFEVSSSETAYYASSATMAGKRVAPSPPVQLAAQGLMAPAMSMPEPVSAEGYSHQEEHGWKQVSNAPLSTFAVDVDSASYANVRRLLRSGQRPPIDAVKVEELVNAFTYNYAAPEAYDQAPLRANLEVAAAPWAPEHRLVRVGLKAREMSVAERAPANLVFLLDVSGSMNRPAKLPLVKEAMRMLVGQLREQDRVAIVTYAGQSGLALPSTSVGRSREIIRALDQLSPGGSTHGSSGIHLAYDVAKANFVAGGVNRVILCTDGDFNAGTTGLGELERLIEAKAKSGVFLTALGFGTGNYQDDTLERLANRGNGAHGYIDSVREARRLLVEQVNGTLATVAQDVKIQVEFNPAQVSAYRLIGYNNRRLTAEEFNDDTVDAGEIGAGHTVTALYEVVPAGRLVPEASGQVDALRYQVTPGAAPSGRHAHEMLTVKVRAQPPGGGRSELHEFPLVDGGRSFDGATPDFKFAAAVAGFGLKLRSLPAAEQFGYAQVAEWGRAGIVTDPGGHRSEFLDLVKQAAAVSRDQQGEVR